MTNTNPPSLNIQSIFPTVAKSPGKIEAGAVAPINTSNKSSGASGGRAAQAAGNKMRPQVQFFAQEVKALRPTVERNNQTNFSNLFEASKTQGDAIALFQKSIGPIQASTEEPNANVTKTGFNMTTAQKFLNTSSLDFSGLLNSNVEDANVDAENANTFGEKASNYLETAGNLFDGSKSSLLSGGAQIATGLGMLSTSGFTLGATGIAGLAMIGKGGMEIATGSQNASKGGQESEEAEQTGTEATRKYADAAKDLEKNDVAIAQLKNFYEGANNQAFPVLAQAQRGNDNLFTLGASLGANVQAPATPANPADPSPAVASNGTPTVPAPANVADASWATPTSPPPTGDTAQAGGSTAPTALGVQAPLAGGNTAPEPPQAGGLTDAEVAFMKAFKENPGVVNAANGQLQGALGSAPTGFNTEGLASQTVTDASQSQPLQELYARLEAKKNQAEGQQAQPSQGLGTAFIGNGVNPQDPTVVAQAQAPNDGQAQAPQAPGGTPATPASTATAPTRAGLTIPKLAQAPAALAPQPAFA
jgi:hypothetical protein